MASTIKDVAISAKVSPSTVSRVINDDPRISNKTKKIVQKEILRLDYKMNTIARSLKTKKTLTIGFITPEIPNDFFMNIAKGVEVELRKYGYTVIICNSNESINEEKDRIELLIEKRVDGIVIIPASNKGKHYNLTKKQKIPVVLIDRLVKNFNSDAVLVDNETGSYKAVLEIIKSGNKEIGFIGGGEELTIASERYKGYLKALKDNKIKYNKRYVKMGNLHMDSGYKLIEELLKENPTLKYIFIANHYMHVGATKYLIENRDKYKRKIEIASFDDMELSALLEFCKVKVKQPMIEMGMIAARYLIERINETYIGEDRILRLETEIILD